MQVVTVDLRRSHYGSTAGDVCHAFNVGRGTSTLLGMTVDPVHRPTLEEYLDIVGWKLENTEGEAYVQWRAIDEHLRIVLKAGENRYRENVRKTIAQAGGRRP